MRIHAGTFILFISCLSPIFAEPIALTEKDVSASFEQTGNDFKWTTYTDLAENVSWSIGGPAVCIDMESGKKAIPAAFDRLEQTSAGEAPAVVLYGKCGDTGVLVRQQYSFCGDGRTLRIQTSLRAESGVCDVASVSLLELSVDGEAFQLTGPKYVSCPVFSNRLFAGIEHPSADCQAGGDSLCLSQPVHLQLAAEWVELPSAVLGSASREDRDMAGDEALRRAFLRYLDTVRWKPLDMHIHYNDWWTAPVPSSETFVLGNIAALKTALFDTTGFFFDSYAMDMGWSDPHSVWGIDRKAFPEGFARIRDALAAASARPGLWISPSSLYPPALDNQWLQSAGYETTLDKSRNFLAACLAKGGRYQSTMKTALLGYAKEGHFAHVKFDGYTARCDEDTHGHPAGDESYLPVANGLMDIFDALHDQDPGIVLEPTCFGYNPSPWWLMHTPFIIGPFGDDSPHGRCPAPEWVEAMITGREIANLDGRASFLMPSSALQCFDVIVQCPGDFQNLAAMAIGRGRWFLSCYINPKYMDVDEWGFFAELIAWARDNREFLQEPMPFGGNPAKREAYGYAFHAETRQLFCIRNPWIESASLTPPQWPMPAETREVRMLYPRREVIARIAADEPLPPLPLGPYETQFIEVVPCGAAPTPQEALPQPEMVWMPSSEPSVARIVYENTMAPFGPDWTCAEGDAKEQLIARASGQLSVQGARSAEVCVLVEGGPEVKNAVCHCTVDGQPVAVTASTSEGAFCATGAKMPEHWTWFLMPIPMGEHAVAVELKHVVFPESFSVYLRGAMDATGSAPHFDGRPAFPLYRPGERPWSHTLVAATPIPEQAPIVETRPKTVVRIDGVYLDALDWNEATAGWGTPQRRLSVMQQPMTLLGMAPLRGIGTHAPSKIVYALPEGYKTFAATIGYDREVLYGSVVFVVQTDGVERYRSPVMRHDTPPADISASIEGAKELILIVEDAGDGVGADHADWANAQIVK